MKKVLLILIPILLIGGAVAWYLLRGSNTARMSYYRTVQASQFGDEEEFLKGFTKKSAKLIKAVLVLAETTNSVKSPLRYLVFGKVISEKIRTIKTADEASFELEIPEDAEEDKDPPKEIQLAVLKVRQGKAKPKYIVMVQEEGEWKIDAWRIEMMHKDRQYRGFLLGKKVRKRK